jgi:intracellular sulfur oxidation DsrE/DsrF family protein
MFSSPPQSFPKGQKTDDPQSLTCKYSNAKIETNLWEDTIMKHLILSAALTAAALCAPLAALADGKTHHVAVHVDQNDPQVLNMALNNVQNLTKYYESQGDTAIVEVVAYGPGLMMYVKDKSPVAERIKAMAMESDNVSFAACGNTLKAMNAKAGQEVALLEEATVVPSGVVRLVELQEAGYTYIRP